MKRVALTPQTFFFALPDIAPIAVFRSHISKYLILLTAMKVNVQRFTVPFVSIIIPVYNEEKFVSACLESLSDMDYPKDAFEIIVIDNGSTDNTVAICKEHTSSVLVCPDVNVSEMRNIGVSKAKGEILAFLDGDCTVDKNWLRAAIGSLEMDTCITGADCDMSPHANWLEKTWVSHIKRKGRGEVSHIGTANMIVAAEVFRKIGGFDSRLQTGEDYEFSVRARSVAKIMSDDRIRVRHLGNPKTIIQFMRREMWHGLGAFGSLKSQLVDKPLIGTILFSVLFFSQIISVLAWISGGSAFGFIGSSAGMLGLLLATVMHRYRQVADPLHAFRLILLYYMYYLARSISVFCLLFRIRIIRKR